MTVINLPEGTHTIKWTLSNYNDLVAQIKVSSSGAITCVSVTSGACGGSSVPRVIISGTTVTGFMKYGTVSPTPTTCPTPYASFTYTTIQQSSVGRTIRLNSSGSSGGSGHSITEYRWYVDNVYRGSGLTRDLILDLAQHTLKLVAKNDCGKTDDQTKTISSTGTPTPSQFNYQKIQAENYTIINSPMVKVYNQHQEGNYYIYNPSGYQKGGYANYEFNIPKSGRYKLMAYVLADNHSHNSFSIKVDSQQVHEWDITPKSTWQWVNISVRGTGTDVNPQYPIYYNTLGPGKHIVRIFDREELTKLKKIIVTNDINFVPGSTIPTPTPHITPTPGPTNSYNNWLNNKGGQSGLKYNLSALLEIIDGYLGFKNLGFSVSLSNLLNTVDGYLGF